ncbi:MAG: calcium/proton exchanger [Pyrinomonadaceae bacterium]
MTLISNITRGERIVIIVAFLSSTFAAVLHGFEFGAVLTFIIAAVALAALASLVGNATEQIGERLSPGATGVLQAAIGNLPELFVAIFALRAGLVTIVQASLVGSILANSLLVLGLAFLVGGWKHGTQRFPSETPRLIATLIVLSIAALTIPTLAVMLHTPAGNHAEGLSIICAIALLVVFAASLPFSIQGASPTTNENAVEETVAIVAGEMAETAIANRGKALCGESTPLAVKVEVEAKTKHIWSLWFALAVLAVAGVGAAFVSDWFVEALQPTIKILGLSEAFTGLIIVAIAGNAVENLVGIKLAARNKPDYAVSVILNSSLQIALGLIPMLVLLSFFIGGAHLTLVLPPLLVVALGLAAGLGALIVYDGESIWLEGVALIGLYVIIAASFWWG